MTAIASLPTATRFEIQFPSYLLRGRDMAFPCDACGNVELDQLSEASRRDYFFARIMIRRERAQPKVVPSATE